MHLFIVLLIFIICPTASLQAASTFQLNYEQIAKITYYEKHKEWIAKNPVMMKRFLEKIDEDIKKALEEPSSAEDYILALSKARRDTCREKADVCKHIPWAQIMCSESFKGSDVFLASMWRDVFDVTTKETAWQTALDCSTKSKKNPDSWMKAFNEVFKPTQDKASKISFFAPLTKWQTPLFSTMHIEWLDAYVDPQKNKPLNSIEAFKAAKLIVAEFTTHSKSLSAVTEPNLIALVNSISQLGTLTPAPQDIERLNLSFEKLKMWKAYPNQIMLITFASCLAYRISGKYDSCEKWLDNVKNSSANSVDLDLEKATLLFEQGKVAPAEAIIAKIDSSNLWINFLKSQIAIQKKDFKTAQNFLQRFQKLNITSWAKSYSYILEAIIARNEGNFPQAQNLLKLCRQAIENDMSGYVLPMAYTNLEELRLAYSMKDQARFNLVYKELNAAVAETPMKMLFMSQADALSQALNQQKENSKASLALAEKNMGANHPEILLTAAILAQ